MPARVAPNPSAVSSGQRGDSHHSQRGDQEKYPSQGPPRTKGPGRAATRSLVAVSAPSKLRVRTMFST